MKAESFRNREMRIRHSTQWRIKLFSWTFCCFISSFIYCKIDSIINNIRHFSMHNFVFAKFLVIKSQEIVPSVSIFVISVFSSFKRNNRSIFIKSRYKKISVSPKRLTFYMLSRLHRISINVVIIEILP